MKFTAKKEIEKGLGYWTVVVEGQKWKDAVKKGKNKVASSVEIPGFRKGKAPKEKLEKYITPVKYLNAALQSIIDSAWKFALEQDSEIKPFNSPVPTPKKINEDYCEIDFIFDLKPEINIKDYKGIKDDSLKKEEVKVTKDEIEKAINQYREKFAMEKDKDVDSKVAKGDVVTFDFEGFIDGVAFPGGKGLDFKLDIGSGKMVPGFEDQMIGKKLGESTIKVTFPKDYTPELSEKEAEFKLNIKSIKEKILPNKDDELAKDLNIPDINTFKDLESYVKNQIKEQKDTQFKTVFVNKVIELISKNSVIEIPKTVIDKEVDNLYKEFEAKVQGQKLTMKDYKKKTGLTDKSIREELRNDAIKRLESYLITDKVRNTEKFDVSEDEISSKYEKLAKSFGVEVDYIKNNLLPTDHIKEEIIKEKIIDFLFQNNG
ncbi:trigger factor [Spiroplasma corruscae]|uniref:Trigger factor n=1 Tax=Spiroplasma corruscae TaxID=216934 RepID=A0A222ENL1_9MOLU|nr:trigger factor [Spiroplasma corruscae]ASP28078.1 trigger factor [Spiroplasma corruscae]